MDALKPAVELAALRRPGFPGESEAYAQARQALLQEEIAFRRHMTSLVEQRQALPPGPVIEKEYRFKDEQGLRLASASCLATRTRSSPTSGCMGRSGNAHARCAPTGWAR
nr:DUF899 family protein [Sphingobium bisphenolivorans]